MNKEAECKCEDPPKPTFGDYAKVTISCNTRRVKVKYL